LHIWWYGYGWHGNDDGGRNGAGMLCYGRCLSPDIGILHLDSLPEYSLVGVGKILENERCRQSAVRISPKINYAIWLNIVTRIQPDPKETYQQALEKAGTPKETLVSGNPLNKTSMISDDDYISNYNALIIFEDMEVVHERFG
jgi:hypothetical protein